MIDPIRRRRDFQLLRDAGRHRRSGPLGLRCVIDERAPGSSTDQIRVAYAIGRSVGGAVVRNRLRRQVRAVLTDLDRRGAVAPGWYLVIVSPEARSLHFSELQAHVERLMTGSSAGAPL